MTAEELRRHYEQYSWDPYHPLALILVDGQRVYIDMPEQVRLTPDELVITRRRDPQRPERYRYESITDLVPALELPPEPGGISYAEFDPLIRRLLMAEPFEPFIIELRNGERITISRRPEIGRAGRHINLHGGSYQPSHLTYDQVARLVPQSGSVPV